MPRGAPVWSRHGKRAQKTPSRRRAAAIRLTVGLEERAVPRRSSANDRGGPGRRKPGVKEAARGWKRRPHRFQLLLGQLAQAQAQHGTIQVPDLQDVAPQAMPQEKGRQVRGQKEDLAQGFLRRKRVGSPVGTSQPLQKWVSHPFGHNLNQTKPLPFQICPVFCSPLIIRLIVLPTLKP